MFTGIIESVSPITAIREAAGKRYLQIQRPAIFDDIKIGSSIASDGICLTVLSLDESMFEVEIMAETLHKSTAGIWERRRLLNLERAMRTDGRWDGHIVQGHVDSVVKLKRIRNQGDTKYLYFNTIPEDGELMVPQGSIAINGVSLTIAELANDSFAVALISHTLENSNLALLNVGDPVNVEYDVIGKYIQRRGSQKQISQEWLYEQGF
ncbi:MAG: riboflavin synthase [Candidatus Cloacimonetes bacterium]|nr:riboflavin synthase [Candidatus Cloacimonadota bacterium]